MASSGWYARKQWPGLARPRRSKTYHGDKSSPAGEDSNGFFFSFSVLLPRRTIPRSRRPSSLRIVVSRLRHSGYSVTSSRETEGPEDARIGRINREINRRKSRPSSFAPETSGCGISLSLATGDRRFTRGDIDRLRAHLSLVSRVALLALGLSRDSLKRLLTSCLFVKCHTGIYDSTKIRFLVQCI